MTKQLDIYHLYNQNATRQFHEGSTCGRGVSLETRKEGSIVEKVSFRVEGEDKVMVITTTADYNRSTCSSYSKQKAKDIYRSYLKKGFKLYHRLEQSKI